MADYYVLNNKRCEFLYLVLKPVKGFALTKKFWHHEIYPKYSEFIDMLKVEALLRYNRHLKAPLLDHMK